MDLKTFLSYAFAIFLRWMLYISPYKDDITNRIEISTPLNSMHRVVESLYRKELGVDPYSSDVLHESPLHLYFYETIINLCGEYLFVFFIFCDVITGHCLYLVAKKYMFKRFLEQSKNKHNYFKDIQGLIMYGIDFGFTPYFVLNVYLFNPYTFCSCMALTTTVIGNLLLGLFFLGISYEWFSLSLISLLFCSTQSLYPIILLSPLFISIKQKHSLLNASFYMLTFFVSLFAFLFVCRELYQSWNFIEHTYGFILSVNDQQPNVGVFWYFFMEMFEHFRLLFIYSYQMNVTILYFIPLSIKFRKDPIVLAACFTMLIAIFKSYPSIGDFAFTMALMPTWNYLYHCMQQIFISGVAIAITTALGPILWDLWIFWGTANANFYFGATLAFITAHIFIMTDIAFGVAKYDYLLKHGNDRKIDGKPAKLVLE